MKKKQKNFASSVTLAIIAAAAAGIALLLGFRQQTQEISFSPETGGLEMFMPLTAAFILMLVVGFVVYYVLSHKKIEE